MVMVFGEITTKAKVDYEKIVRDTVKEIGFISNEVGLDGTNCKVGGAQTLVIEHNAAFGPRTSLYLGGLVRCSFSKDLFLVPS